MGETTEISWTDHTFNPWWGCTKVSPACDHCYAETFSKRIGYGEGGTKFPIWGKDEARRFFGDKHWDEPRKWNRDALKTGVRKRVFCGSMCDVMEDYNGTEHLVRETIEESRRWLYRLIEDTPHLDWLLLTKRPQNFRRFLPHEWLDRPRPNVWGLTTMESEEYHWRAWELLKTPFAVRGLSIEPLLGPIDLDKYELLCKQWRSGLTIGKYLDWVIVGGESGHGSRPMREDWARSLRDQCVASGVAFHFKQWGDYGYFDQVSDDIARELDAGGMDQTDQPIRIGKKAAGRLLDGRTWDEFPSVITGEAA